MKDIKPEKMALAKKIYPKHRMYLELSEKEKTWALAEKSCPKLRMSLLREKKS